MDASKLQRYAPSVGIFIMVFLAYGSQIFFLYIEPYTFAGNRPVILNLLILCVWTCFWRASNTQAGYVELNWEPSSAYDALRSPLRKRRWCQKCKSHKPPRAHHCKTCNRCVTKMDHHCVWTANCVSHTTFPHFTRYLFYSVASLIYLECLLFARVGLVWSKRNLPSYLGPSAAQLLWLCIFLFVNSISLFALSILFIRTVWSLATNVTTIESWEIERHEALTRRAKHFGGYLDAPDGSRIRIAHQEFPYDIGIWSNIVQGMNGGPLTWFWPFSQTSAFSDGLSYETNGFEDDSVIWPPPDPDRMFSRTSVKPQGNPFLYDSPGHTNTDQLEAFQARQQYDLQRREGNEYHIQRREPFHQRYGKSNLPVTEKPINQPGEEAWRNSEGDRLEDFGVDEDVEFYDEDDVPLAELIRRRREAEEN